MNASVEKIAIIGSTGLLGQALIKEAKKRNISVVGIARKHADINLDARDSIALLNALDQINPQYIINAVAQVNLDSCEKDPGSAYVVNASIVAHLSNYARTKKCKFCHISTDHYFTGDQDFLHNEKSSIILLNEYAKTKYAGECFALSDSNNLVVRTNIVGFRGWAGQPTFVEWVISALKAKSPITMFSDFFTSSIDVTTFSQALFDILFSNRSGLIHLASRECSSKMTFILRLANRLGLDTAACAVGSVASNLNTARGDSLGLDVSYAESLLGYKLPDLDAVIDSLAKEYEG